MMTDERRAAAAAEMQRMADNFRAAKPAIIQGLRDMTDSLRLNISAAVAPPTK